CGTICACPDVSCAANARRAVSTSAALSELALVIWREIAVGYDARAKMAFAKSRAALLNESCAHACRPPAIKKKIRNRIAEIFAGFSFRWAHIRGEAPILACSSRCPTSAGFWQMWVYLATGSPSAADHRRHPQVLTPRCLARFPAACRP